MDNKNENYKKIILAESKEIAINEGISKINIRTVAKKRYSYWYNIQLFSF